MNAQIQAERVRLARMIEAMVQEEPWADNANSRMALAIAASNVRRGRPLTSAEKFANLCNAIAEDDPELAHRLRQLTASESRVSALQAALAEIAAQKTVSELCAEFGDDYEGDWQDGYDHCVATARRALSQETQP